MFFLKGDMDALAFGGGGLVSFLFIPIKCSDATLVCCYTLTSLYIDSKYLHAHSVCFMAASCHVSIFFLNKSERPSFLL